MKKTVQTSGFVWSCTVAKPSSQRLMTIVRAASLHSADIKARLSSISYYGDTAHITYDVQMRNRTAIELFSLASFLQKLVIECQLSLHFSSMAMIK